jgi:hypothetical protein
VFVVVCGWLCVCVCECVSVSGVCVRVFFCVRRAEDEARHGGKAAGVRGGTGRRAVLSGGGRQRQPLSKET